MEFTHSEDPSSEQGYLVGIKSMGTYVELTPEHLVMKNVHDMSLVMKHLRVMDIQSVNIPVIWKDPTVKFRCVQVFTDKHASLEEVSQTSTQEPFSIDQTEMNLCFHDDQQRDDWTASIRAMKECTRGDRLLRHVQE